MSEIPKPKILVILGPTAVGKSDIAVTLAKKFNGEIVSADSRQVYKGMDTGTGKITKKEMGGVKHYLLDVVSPQTVFNVIKYRKLAEKAIEEILAKNKLPIICGGTGFYIQALVDNPLYPDVKPDPKLRAQLEKMTTTSLLLKLQKLDRARYESIDQANRVKIIRALEIALALGSVPKVKLEPKYDALQIGLTLKDKVLKDRILIRLKRRMESGMISEVKKLHAEGVSWKRLESFGLEYRYLALYLQNKLTKDEMIRQLNSAIWHYARRQKTWFRRDKRIKWFSPKDIKKIEMNLRKLL